MKNMSLYLCYIGFAFLLMKAYYHLQYDRQRRKTGSLFLRWIFGVYAFSILFPIVSTPNTNTQQRLKSIANIAIVGCYVFFILTLVFIYAKYRR
jgi:hypothetical protein